MAEDAFGIVGTVIASAYHVESVVAEGGFGTVYRAHHGGFRAPVALKCLRLPPGIMPDARQHFLESFRAEAELLFRLSASIPTVVRPLHVDAFTVADGRFVPYLVLEWLEGSTLDALIRKRKSDGQAPFALKKLVRLLTPVARALERAHNFQGPNGPVSIVHRDLKPENIFVANVAGEEVVKILDFGIGKAKSMASQAAGRASQGNKGIATFTPAYGSPEQWAPKRYGQTGPWTDVWGLALTLTEGLVGHPIIDGDPAAIMGTILDPARRPTPGSEGVIISDEVERVFEKALALDPRERYADAGVFWNELLAAARITSGEVQEVRLPRDARAEQGGGQRVERVEALGRRPSNRPPSQQSLPRPRFDGRPAAFNAPTQEARPLMTLPALDEPSPLASGTSGHDSAAAHELEFELKPLGQPSPAPFPPAVSGSFEVPDLDLAPVSRPTPQRTSSGLRPAVVAPPLELDELAAPEVHSSGSFDLDLDLPAHDPLVRRASSGGMPAVRPSEPPPPGSLRTPLPARPSQPPQYAGAPPQYSASPPPVVVSSAPPAVSAAPPRRISIPPVISVPPVSSGNPPAGGVPPYTSVPAPKPAFQLSFSPAPESTLLERLMPGLILLGLAVIVTIVDRVYTAVTDDIFSIGPLTSSAMAGLLLLAAIALGAFRLLKR